ncbi:MAG: lysophospholipid acyltransferase family protein [Pseudomonadota bacterium]
MQQVRRAVRVIALAIVSVVGYLPLLLVSILPAASPLRLRTQSLVLMQWSRAVCRIIGLVPDVIGQPPTQTGVFVANHLSYIDIVLIASEMRTAFVAKSDVQHWPLVGHLVTVAGTVYVDRQRNRSLPTANAAIRARLAADTSVVVFAEGSSTAGESVLPFRPSLLQMAAEFDYPVNYGYLSYRIDTASDNEARTADQICWWGDAGFARHILNLLALPGFAARLVFGETPMRGSDRKRLAKQLHSAVDAQLGKYRWKFEA